MGTVDKGERTLETVGRQLGAERLARVGRVDHQRLAGEVLFLVLLGIDPVLDPLDLLGRGFGHIFYCGICAHSSFSSALRTNLSRSEYLLIALPNGVRFFSQIGGAKEERGGVAAPRRTSDDAGNADLAKKRASSKRAT